MKKQGFSTRKPFFCRSHSQVHQLSLDETGKSFLFYLHTLATSINEHKLNFLGGKNVIYIPQLCCQNSNPFLSTPYFSNSFHQCEALFRATNFNFVSKYLEGKRLGLSN